MGIYAVIKTGGKQYRVAPGDVVKVEKLALAPGATLEISDVYMLVNERGVTAGNPAIPNARVVAEVLEQGRDDKIVVFKMRRRKNYRRTIGHRQHFTLLRINEIALGNEVYKPASRPIPAVSKATATTPAAARPGSDPAPAKTTPAKSTEAPKAPTPTTIAATAPAPATPPVVTAPIVTAPSTSTPAAASPPPNTKDADPVAAPIVDTPPVARTPALEKPEPRREAPMVRADASEASTPRRGWYWLAGALALLLLAGIGTVFFGTERPTRDQAVPTAAQKAPQPVKPKPTVRDGVVKKPGAVSAPSAPVQPPD